MSLPFDLFTVEMWSRRKEEERWSLTATTEVFNDDLIARFNAAAFIFTRFQRLTFKSIEKRIYDWKKDFMARLK